MRYTRKSILDLLCASLQRNIVDVEDLKDVAALYREQDMGLRSCSLNFVVEALRDDIFNVDELKEAARISIAEKLGNRGMGGRPRDSRGERNADLQPGDWLCDKCGHHNFARRTECQREFCKAPRPGTTSRSARPGDWDCEKCGEMNFAYRTECHRTDCKAPRPVGGAEAPERSGRGAGGYGKALDDGDWNCDKCGTMNFARRTECFNNACKAPRTEGSSGGGRAAPFGEPNLRPGDWVCQECDMVNFARRTVCHRTSCMKPRPEED